MLALSTRQESPSDQGDPGERPDLRQAPGAAQPS
jgi:hypothetical protein